MTAPSDVWVQLTSANSSSERRLPLSWTLAVLKARLEPITGIPRSSQRLILRRGGDGVVPANEDGDDGRAAHTGQVIEAPDEDDTTLEHFRLTKGCEIYIESTQPASLRQDFNDPSRVEKYSIPDEIYEKRQDSVLTWKKTNKLGRFDPSAADKVAAVIEHHEREAIARGLEVGRRCRVGGEDPRRGEICYLGPVPEIPAQRATSATMTSKPASASSQQQQHSTAGGGWWVGISLDEPTGKNDGSLVGPDGRLRRYFLTEGCRKSGIFVRPDRVEVGDFPVLDLEGEMEEM